MAWNSLTDVVIQERKAGLPGRWAGSCEVMMGENELLSQGPAQLLPVLVDSPPSKGLTWFNGYLQGGSCFAMALFSKNMAELVSGGASVWVLWFSQF